MELFLLKEPYLNELLKALSDKSYVDSQKYCSGVDYVILNGRLSIENAPRQNRNAPPATSTILRKYLFSIEVNMNPSSILSWIEGEQRARGAGTRLRRL
jgi:hypothetical protein